MGLERQPNLSQKGNTWPAPSWIALKVSAGDGGTYGDVGTQAGDVAWQRAQETQNKSEVGG